MPVRMQSVIRLTLKKGKMQFDAHRYKSGREIFNCRTILEARLPLAGEEPFKSGSLNRGSGLAGSASPFCASSVSPDSDAGCSLGVAVPAEFKASSKFQNLNWMKKLSMSKLLSNSCCNPFEIPGNFVEGRSACADGESSV